jgi:hypothetical protein
LRKPSDELIWSGVSPLTAAVSREVLTVLR